jgi:hypothetical protein
MTASLSSVVLLRLPPMLFYFFQTLLYPSCSNSCSFSFFRSHTHNHLLFILFVLYSSLYFLFSTKFHFYQIYNDQTKTVGFLIFLPIHFLTSSISALFILCRTFRIFFFVKKNCFTICDNLHNLYSTPNWKSST